MKPPRRHWFQFGISTWLVVTLLAALLLGWRRERISRWVDSLVKVPAEPAVDKPSARSVPDEVDDQAIKREIEAAIDWGPYPRDWAQLTGLRTKWDDLEYDLPVIYPDDEAKGQEPPELVP